MNISTPWGISQSVINIAPGIRKVSTAGHGGVLISPSKNLLIPEYMRNNSGEYEEDCEWCIPAVVFESEWRIWADMTQWTTGDRQMGCAWYSFKNWHPDAYEKFTGKTLLVGESHNKDELLLNTQVRDAFVVAGAWGDWQKGIPKGMVGVLAIRQSDHNKIFALVPKEEYKEKKNLKVGQAGVFVVDLARHQSIPIPQYAM